MAKRSGFEEKVGQILEPEGFMYETTKHHYTIAHKYTPDFVLGEILVECKGWFRPGDRQKYRAVRDGLKQDLFENWELVFLLQSPNKRVQKGAQLTMAGWCDKEGIKWFSMDNIEDLIAYARETLC